MKIAILGRQNPASLRQEACNYLTRRGHQAKLFDMETRNVMDFMTVLTGYDAIISCGEAFPAPAIQYLAEHGLKLISRCGVGTDEIDHAAATACGVAICNAAGALSTAVAECTLGLMLNLMRQFLHADAEVRHGDWSRFFESRTSRQLEGKTIGLIGFGDIAKALAKMLRGFDCRVLAYDIHFCPEEATALNVTFADIPTIQREADIISLHVPAVPETLGMVDAEFLHAMKRNAYLVNTARGKLVNEPDLIQALLNKDIAGAGLDVFAKEPPEPDNPLLHMEQVVLLPHYGSGTWEALARVCADSARNAADFLEGSPVRTILNPNYISHKD